MLIACLVAAVLAVARLSMLISQDEIMVKFRQWAVHRFGPTSFFVKMIHCDWCVSMWIAALIMPLVTAWPNRWVLAALMIPVGSLVAGFLSKLRG